MKPSYRRALVRLFLFFLLSSATLARAARGRIPCHRNRREQDENNDCGVVVFPPGLCSACKLRPFLKNGEFAECDNIYNVETEECREELEKYVRLNPCDRQRKSLLRDKSRDNILGLDYFVYSICEECCDCIPIGTKEGQYTSLKKEGELFKVDRANCATHLTADVCNVIPDVRYVRRPDDPVPENLNQNWPEICPIVRNWKKNAERKRIKLSNNNNVSIPDSLRKFLSVFVRAANCNDRDTYDTCLKLEIALGRV